MTSKKLVISAAVFIVILFFVTFLCMIFFKNKLNVIHSNQISQYEESIRTKEFLLSTINWSTERQKTILFARDLIIKERQLAFAQEISLDKAYLIAEKNVIEAEKYYPTVDIFKLLAIQRIESCFTDTITSPVGAMGLNQLMPSTSRLLCVHFNIDYYDSMTYDITISIKLAAKLLNILDAVYHDFSLVLADYNGGPYQAYYYKTKDARLCKETADFVKKVIQKHDNYKQQFLTYKVDSIYLANKNDYNKNNNKRRFHGRKIKRR